MVKSSSAAENKKQATPSQKRLQKQQQQQQQQQQEHSTGVTPSKGLNKPHDLDVKVGQLTDKNESCKEILGSRLAEFSEKAAEIKSDISLALERQAKWVNDGDQAPDETVRELRERLVELAVTDDEAPAKPTMRHDAAKVVEGEASKDQPAATGHERSTPADVPIEPSPGNQAASSARGGSFGSSPLLTEEQAGSVQKKSDTGSSSWFEPLTARLDPKSKFVTLKASLKKNFNGSPELIDSVCHKLVDLSHQIDQLKLQNDYQQRELSKLRLIKERLGDLCRELQKSNNQVRIESLNLIRDEQHKAKEQAGKIQTTLAGVMKLFDENQQRNSSLKQENLELQSKLKMLLKHCENWEQCVETAIKQRDIENRLVKTELARLTLARAEEQERFLKEKQQLLKAIETMRQHQSRVEDKEAKLRSDLSSYASKYDQCQDMIQNGLGRFQLESKRMLSQIERSRQDYVTLLGKYEASNKKIKQLLEEKQKWLTSTAQGNKKLEALEKLCRSLKSENDRLTRAESGQVAQDCLDSKRQ